MTIKRVDSFGNAMIGSAGAFRARLIQTDAMTFAIFPESGDPGELHFQDIPVIKGRVMNATLIDDQEFVFQRASCGCQTPAHLRGPARIFLERLAQETADA